MKPKFCKKASNGFTLIEMLLVISILMGVGILEMRKNAAKSKEVAAVAVGKQMAMVSKAAEEYMVTKASLLQAMNDPNCPAIGNSCALSVEAMIAEGYLPADFSNLVQFGGDYTVKILRVAPPAPPQAGLLCGKVNPTPVGCTDQTGGVPTWQWSLQGLVFTTLPWTNEGSGVNTVMLGQAAKQIGPLAGISKNGVAEGLYGGWGVPGLAYGAALTDGQLVYMAGSKVNVWSQFIRTDGSLPMTGTLDMGGHDIIKMRDMFINGPSTHIRNKNLSSMLPNWVFKGVYSANDGEFVTPPLCARGGIAKIKLMMQVMEGTKAGYYNDKTGSVSSDTDAALAQFKAGAITSAQAQQTVQTAMASNSARHSMNSWATGDGIAGWNVYFQDIFEQDDTQNRSTPLTATSVKGSGLAELYCHYPDQ